MHNIDIVSNYINATFNIKPSLNLFTIRITYYDRIMYIFEKLLNLKSIANNLLNNLKTLCIRSSASLALLCLTKLFFFYCEFSIVANMEWNL